MIGELRLLPELVIEQGGAGYQVVCLVGDEDLLAVRLGVVVVVGEEVLDVTLGQEVEPEVEPDVVGAVGVDHLVDLALPLVDERLIPHRPVHVRLAVEIGVRGVSGVVALVPDREEEPVGRVMEGGDELHVPRLDGPLQLAHHVALRPHLGRVPVRVPGVPHGEAVVVLGHGAGKFRPRLGEQIGPLVGIEVLGRELRDEVLVAEVRRQLAEGLLEVRARPGIRAVVQGERVPGGIRAVGVHRIRSPVRVDPELAVAQPIRHLLVAAERVPRRLVVRDLAIVRWCSTCDRKKHNTPQDNHTRQRTPRLEISCQRS